MRILNLPSEPIEYNTQNGETFYKIYINKLKQSKAMPNEDNKNVSLIFSLKKYYSLGLRENRKFGNLSLPLNIKKDDEFLDVFNGIIKDCKQYLMELSEDGFTELKGLKSTNLKDGRPPILYVNLTKSYNTRKVIPEFYRKEKIDGPASSGKLIRDPLIQINKECIVNAAVKFESIYIKGKIISLQVKLYEAEISPSDKKLRKSEPKKRLLV